MVDTPPSPISPITPTTRKSAIERALADSTSDEKTALQLKPERDEREYEADADEEEKEGIVEDRDQALLASRLPPPLHFPAVLLLSLALSSGAYTVAAPYLVELGEVSRKVETWWGVWGVVLWRGFEIALGWYGKFDSYDLVSLSLVSRGPVLYLLHSFYNISPQPLLLSLLIDIATTSLPFYLFRSPSPAHAGSKSRNIPNRDLLTDSQIQTFITLLTSTIYSVSLSTALATYLPTALAVYFNNLPSLTSAYTSSPVTLFPLCLPLGLAAKSFIFTPATTAAGPKPKKFDPTTATLSETFWHNVWGWNVRTKTVIARTAVLMLVSGGSTFVQSFVSLEGVEPLGALAYAGVWAFAALVSGVALGAAGAV
ncbi:hypothetical protein F5884DRAFT_663122 [Xylogone sp. PMI_703]|nr:hypothetical protein F5884DRAFT_663122 [Xylogone sp. PMI_703]